MDSIKKIQEDLQKALGINSISYDHFKRFEAKLNELANPMKNIYLQDNFVTFSKSQWLEDIKKQSEKNMAALVQKTLTGINTSTYFSKYIKQIENDRKKMLETILPSIKHMETMAEKFANQGLPNGSLVDLMKAMKTASVDVSTSVDVEDIRLSIQAFEVEVQAIESRQEDNFNQLVELIENQKNPLVVQILMIFLFPFILNLLSNLTYDRLIGIISPTKEEAKKVSIKSTTNTIKTIVPYKKLRQNIRIVSANVLNVREGKSTKKQIIGYLFFGNIVEIVDKQRNWSLIRKYDPESETYIQGWVFTRYLKRVR